MKKKRNQRLSKNEASKLIVINKAEILRENLHEISKWIAFTTDGIPLIRLILDDFYRACLYFIAKACGSRLLNFFNSDRVSIDELERMLSR